MTIVELLLLLLVAGLSGSVAQSIVGYSRGGCLTAIVVGFIGALLGSWMARELELPEPFMLTLGGTEFPVLWSVIGASLFVAVISLISGRRKRV